MNVPRHFVYGLTQRKIQRRKEAFKSMFGRRVTLDEEAEMSFGGSDTQAVVRSKGALEHYEEAESDPGTPQDEVRKLDFFGVSDLKEGEGSELGMLKEEEKELERSGNIT